MSSTITDRLQGLSTSVAVKAPCVVATTANISLSGLQTVDAIPLAEGDRVLVWHQTNAAQNGIYNASTLAWDRVPDLDGGDDIVDGTSVFVLSGNTTGSQWFNATLGDDFPIEVGTDTITWAVTYLGLTAQTPASETTAGIAELATQAEANTGTDDLRVMTPLKARVSSPVVFEIPVTTETAAVTSGAGKVTFRMPFAFTVTTVRASLKTAQATGSILTVDINDSGTSILSTKLTIDNTEKTSTTAATPPVLSDTAIADDAEVTIDVDQIGDGTGVGLKVAILGYRS